MLRVLAFNPRVLLVHHTPPTCKTCRFYKKDTEECAAFAVQDPVTGLCIYRSAIEARNSPHMCGHYGDMWASKFVCEMYPSLKEDISKNKK